MPTNAYRYLRGYTLDPGFSTLIDTHEINQTTYRINWEDLAPGPVGEYLEIIDHDPASNCFYAAVDLNSAHILAQHGLAPSEGNPQFHQQFVYTMAMRTIEIFEEALGRKIIWNSFQERTAQGYKEHYTGKLRLYPHAFRGPNAYYDPEKKAILFGYFKASENRAGANFPGGTIFTCLSPDIIIHEMTHAILDAIHPRYIENTNQEVAAFHEAFADTVALLQRFTNLELLKHQLERSQGSLSGETVLGELATQFGQGLKHGGHGALRSAIGSYQKGKWTRLKPDYEKRRQTSEPHELGALFVAAFFDAFIRKFEHHTMDLYRLSRYNIINNQALQSPDLISRLAKDAATIASNLLKICIQALDFTPPCDITFGDYIRALITADYEMTPEDTQGYRIALIEAFRDWGFYADRVNTMSVDSLLWSDVHEMLPAKENLILRKIVHFIKPKIREILGLKNRERIFIKSKETCALIHEILVQKRIAESVHEYIKLYSEVIELEPFYLDNGKETNSKYKCDEVFEFSTHEPENWKSFLNKIGLISREDIETIGSLMVRDNQSKPEEQITIPFNEEVKIEVHSVRPVNRYSREGQKIDQVVLTLLQTLRVSEENDEYGGFKYRGGCTLIFELSEDSGLKYVILKRLGSKNRLLQQLGYESSELFVSLTSTYNGATNNTISIKNLHQIK